MQVGSVGLISNKYHWNWLILILMQIDYLTDHHRHLLESRGLFNIDSRFVIYVAYDLKYYDCRLAWHRKISIKSMIIDRRRFDGSSTLMSSQNRLQTIIVITRFVQHRLSLHNLCCLNVYVIRPFMLWIINECRLSEKFNLIDRRRFDESSTDQFSK